MSLNAIGGSSLRSSASEDGEAAEPAVGVLRFASGGIARCSQRAPLLQLLFLLPRLQLRLLPLRHCALALAPCRLHARQAAQARPRGRQESLRRRAP